MTLTRRDVLRGFGAGGLCALGGCIGVSDVVKAVDDFRTVARLGVLANTRVGWINETRTLAKAFNWFRSQEVDAVAIAGAVTKNGYKDQFDVLNAVWEKAFRDTRTRLIVDEGEHEVNGCRFALRKTRPLKRPEALTFHGEWKNPLTDELGYYPRSSNVVFAGSMTGVELPFGYEPLNGGIAGKMNAAAQGLLVSAYSGSTVMRRIDFTQNAPEDLAEPWRTDSADPTEIPQFARDAVLQVIRGYGAKDGSAVYTVRWPNVLRRFGAVARAYGYEVAVYEAETSGSREAAKPGGRALLRRNVLTDGFFLSEDRDLAVVKCVFSGKDLKGAEAVRFSVTPVGSLGEGGNALMSEKVVL